MAKVSVIIPVYNVEKYVKTCIESVQSQTIRDIEIIVVNDGATDNSRRLIAEIDDERVIIIDKENGGLSSARNVGIEAASGQYLAFVDSDDWVAPDYIEKMYRICEEYDCDMVQCSYADVYDEDKHYLDDAQDGIPTFYTGREFSYAMYTLLSWKCNLTWNKLYRKELFEEIRFPIGKIHEDEFTTYKVAWRANKVGVIPDKLYFYRHRVGSIMQQACDKSRLDAGEAFFERAEFYKNKGELELACMTQERHLEWVKKQKNAIMSVTSCSKNDILCYLDNTEENLRLELQEWMFTKSVKRVTEGVFPFSQVEKNANIILYGGGDIGRQYYRQVTFQNYCNVVLWVDKNYKRCRRHGIPVAAVEQIQDVNEDWRYVVIAIDNPVIVGEVIQLLKEDYNIPQEKIVF